MTDCHLIADRMPDVANGKAVWRASESAHLASCQECWREWDLVRAAQGLGAGVAAALDTGRVADQVARRLAEASPVVRPRAVGPTTRWLIGLAAAAALVLAVRPWRFGGAATNRSNPVAAVSVLNELDDLTPTELESVLEALPSAAEAVPHVETVPFSDLEPKDLERVLRSLEG